MNPGWINTRYALKITMRNNATRDIIIVTTNVTTTCLCLLARSKSSLGGLNSYIRYCTYIANSDIVVARNASPVSMCGISGMVAFLSTSRGFKPKKKKNKYKEDLKYFS
jgi:hypothetical protein